MIYIVLSICFIYATLILLYKIAWNKISESKEVNNNDKVSVVVACRNEETNIKNLIKSEPLIGLNSVLQPCIWDLRNNTWTSISLGRETI